MAADFVHKQLCLGDGMEVPERHGSVMRHMLFALRKGIESSLLVATGLSFVESFCMFSPKF